MPETSGEALKKAANDLVRRLPSELLKHPIFTEVAETLARIASYLKSEQDERIRLSKEQEGLTKQQIELAGKLELIMTKLEDAEKSLYGDHNDLEKNPGIIHDWHHTRKYRERMWKLALGMATGIAVAIILGLLSLLGIKVH